MKVQPLDIKNKKNELHSSVRSLVHQYRWFGFFPVEGLAQEDPFKLRYNLKSSYTIYYVLSFIGQILMTLFSLFWFMERSKTLGTLSYFLFYGDALVGIACSIKLAKSWPNLMCKAAKLEENLADIRISKSIPTKCYIIAHFVMALAYLEHFLCEVYNGMVAMKCVGATTPNILVVRKYFHYRYYYVFDYVELNPVTAILAEVMCFQSTFVWSFVDVLIICISIYFTSYFNDLNKAIKSYKQQDIIPWGKIRAQYSELVILLKEIDLRLSWILMMSFFSNLFFLCFQLFNSLHAMPSSESLVYSLFSFTFLVVRSLTLCVVAANVHKAAQGPLLALYEVPSSVYNIEVQRFQLQLRYTTIGLSGLFFYVTRKTIVKVIGTIITYELILLQFNMNTTLLYSETSVVRTNVTLL
ncbi:gustatory receptor for sugar taste 64f-like [Manduca sexta]|uniref:gustatory receptor for sugar taste 64f-like n=1 Tax=Manduca sexta TaxID=7130 RepID=UPI0011835E33|nr:gustatory receptor for sugar taste 64f-like [Manduca sexta]